MYQNCKPHYVPFISAHTGSLCLKTGLQIFIFLTETILPNSVICDSICKPQTRPRKYCFHESIVLWCTEQRTQSCDSQVYFWSPNGIWFLWCENYIVDTVSLRTCILIGQLPWTWVYIHSIVTYFCLYCDYGKNMSKMYTSEELLGHTWYAWGVALWFIAIIGGQFKF